MIESYINIKLKIMLNFICDLFGFSSTSQVCIMDSQRKKIWYNIDKKTKSATVIKSPENEQYSGTVTIPNEIMYKDRFYIVTGIADDAFRSCRKLERVTIPKGVEMINKAFFYCCEELITIDVDRDNSNYCSYFGVLYNKSKTELKCFPRGKNGELVIPNGVTEICDETFALAELESVIIPSSVKRIGDRAFHSCYNLSRVKITKGVTEIGNYAFEYCCSLKSITIPESVTSIGEASLFCTGLTNIEVEENNLCYSSENGVLFDKLKTHLVCFPLERLSESYEIPEGVKVIDSYAFSNSSNLTNVTMPDSLIKIEKSAFGGCVKLRDITIPANVTEIGDEAFLGCFDLTSVTSLNIVPPTIFKLSFGYDEDINIYVPAESVEKYKAAEGWSKFKNIKAIPAK